MVPMPNKHSFSPNQIFRRSQKSKCVAYGMLQANSGQRFFELSVLQGRNPESARVTPVLIAGKRPLVPNLVGQGVCVNVPRLSASRLLNFDLSLYPFKALARRQFRFVAWCGALAVALLGPWNPAAAQTKASTAITLTIRAAGGPVTTVTSGTNRVDPLGMDAILEYEVNVE